MKFYQFTYMRPWTREIWSLMCGFNLWWTQDLVGFNACILGFGLLIEFTRAHSCKAGDK